MSYRWFWVVEYEGGLAAVGLIGLYDFPDQLRPDHVPLGKLNEAGFIEPAENVSGVN